MKLSEYIEKLQEILVTNGDVENLYTSADDEGNSYNKVSFGAEIRFLPKGEAGNRRPDHLYQESEKEYCEDEEERNWSEFEKVVLL